MLYGSERDDTEQKLFGFDGRMFETVTTVLAEHDDIRIPSSTGQHLPVCASRHVRN